MSNKKKLIELFVYIIIVIIGIVMLLSGQAKSKDIPDSKPITEERRAQNAFIPDTK